jgi:hypothetical protein
MQYRELLTDDAAFSALREECSSVFDTTKRLPKQVFRENFVKNYPFEHGIIMRKDFATFLTLMARTFADSAVNYMTLDPDPVEYYRKKHGFYGLASFEPPTLMNNYLKVISLDGNVDSFRARGGDVSVFWGSSLEWGIVCDRKSWELCVIGCTRELDESVRNSVHCMDPSRLRNYIQNEYKDQRQVALAFLTELTRNYPALA